MALGDDITELISESVFLGYSVLEWFVGSKHVLFLRFTGIVLEAAERPKWSCPSLVNHLGI